MAVQSGESDLVVSDLSVPIRIRVHFVRGCLHMNWECQWLYLVVDQCLFVACLAVNFMSMRSLNCVTDLIFAISLFRSKAEVCFSVCS